MSSMEINGNLLSLSEYSSQYGVSVSTLRRKIKGNKVSFKIINGKYFLPRQEKEVDKAFKPVPIHELAPVPREGAFLNEIKKAYSESLKAKEGQILQLKQQVADLKTLVLFLERENKRLENSF